MTHLVIDGQQEYRIDNYSVTCDSTPILPGDMTGGAGSMSFGIPDDGAIDGKYGKSASLVIDGGHLTFEQDSVGGFVRTASGNMTGVTVAADTRIALLNVQRMADPYSGTLRGAILYYLGLCGVTANIMVETSLASRVVHYPGWEGNVLDYLKDLCAAQSMELSAVQEKFVFRPIGRRTISLATATAPSWNNDESQLAQNVEIAWYETSAPKAGLIYPLGGWNEDVSVISVDAGATVEMEFLLDPEEDEGIGVSVITIEQPTCVGFVPRNQTDSSVYAVCGKDGLPIPPAQWADAGGSVSVALIPGGFGITVTVVGAAGPTIDEYAPFSIAMSSGPSDTYSSLRLRGTGIFYNRRLLKAETGVTADRASMEDAPTVQSAFINSLTVANTMLQRRIRAHSQPRHSVSFEVGGVFPEEVITSTFFDGGSVIESPLSNPFGNLEGSRFEFRGKTYRIRSITATPGKFQISAENDVSIN